MSPANDRTSRSLQRALGSAPTGSAGNTGVGFGLSRMLILAAVLTAVIAICVGAGALTRPQRVSTAADQRPLSASASASGSSAGPTPTTTTTRTQTRWRTRIERVLVPGGTQTRTVYVQVPGPGSTTTRTVTVTGAAPRPAAPAGTAAAKRTAAAAQRAQAAATPAIAQRRLAARAATTSNVTHQVTGWGCYANNSGFFEDGRWADKNDPKNGWMWHGNGGGDCNGGYDSMPMSGGWPDNGRDARFQFDVTPGTTNCSATTWVPNTGNIQAAGGDPTGYDFVDSFDINSGKHLKLAGVDEQANRGRWVDLGTVTTTTGKLMLFEHGNGFPYDKNRTPNWRHHSVTQVRLTCWQ